ncbi:Lrp/AsnC family transcriptional regulator [Arthrobacter sp. R1-13]
MTETLASVMFVIPEIIGTEGFMRKIPIYGWDFCRLFSRFTAKITAMRSFEIDRLDARILLALDEEPDASALSLSRSLGVARNTVHARLARLQAGGVLGPFTRRLRASALGYSLTALVSISVMQTQSHLVQAGLFTIPEVIEVHATTGDADLVAKVLAKDTTDFHRINTEILRLEGIQRTSTVISVLEVMPTRMEGLLKKIAGEGS